MERQVFERMDELADKHWWFVARRRIIDAVIRRIVRPRAGARILELGAGTGHNLAMLSAYGTLDAAELDPLARAQASQRLGRAVAETALPDLSAFADESYDLVALLDVLEHVGDDRATLAAIHAKLKPGGALLLTVPANRWMWSAHDAAHHHHRRYRRGELTALAKDYGYRIELLSFFNTLLFPPIAAARLLGKLAGREEADDRMPAAPLNRLLAAVFGLERHLVGRAPLPFGVSLIAVLRRPGGSA